MDASEDALAAELKVCLDEELAKHFGAEVWDCTFNYNRVLDAGKSKKQPTENLNEAIRQFAQIRQSGAGNFHEYLQQFSCDAGDPKHNDFSLAQRDIVEGSKIVKGELTAKNITRPDLIIHEIGCLTRIEHNLIAFEIKPEWSQSRHLKLLDLARMRAFTQSKEPPDQMETPTYQYGIFLYFTKHSKLGPSWRFEHGVDDPVAFTLDV